MNKNFILFKNDGLANLEERFTSANSKKKHFYDHTGQTSASQADIDAYEAAADALALTPVDHKNILGYEVDPNSFTPRDMRDRRFCKYNKATEEYVVYGGLNQNGEPIVISFYHISWREFQAKYYSNYLDEIPSPEYQKYWDFRHNQRAELVEI